MKLAKERTLRQYTGGKTLQIPSTISSGLLSIKECRTLLRIATRDTINDYLKVLGLFSRDYLNWDEFKSILELQTFLGLKPGKNSKVMYRFLRDNGFIPQIFQEFGVDIEQILEKKQHDYQRQRQAHQNHPHANPKQ